MLIKIQVTTHLLIFCELMINTKVMFKIMKDTALVKISRPRLINPKMHLFVLKSFPLDAKMIFFPPSPTGPHRSGVFISYRGSF